MTDFELIEGKGQPRDHKAEMAQRAFTELTIRIVRSLARGEDHEREIIYALHDFLGYAKETPQPIHALVSHAIENMHKKAFTHSGPESPAEAIQDIVCSALRLAADMLSNGGVAASQASKSRSLLDDAIKENIRGSERSARKDGRSYVAEVTEGIPPIKEPAVTKQKSKKRPEANLKETDSPRKPKK